MRFQLPVICTGLAKCVTMSKNLLLVVYICGLFDLGDVVVIGVIFLSLILIDLLSMVVY